MLLLLYCPLLSFAQTWYGPDAAFGSSGTGRYVAPVNSEFRAIARRSDGSYLVAGTCLISGLNCFYLKRILSDGSEDASFAPLATHSEGMIFDLQMGAAGHFYVCGYLQTLSYQTGFIREYDSDGNYVAQYLLGASPSMVYKIKPLADGTILAAGRENEISVSKDRARLWKVKKDLSGLVTTFGSGASGSDGVARIEYAYPSSSVAGFSSFYGMDVQSDGKILACGSYRPTATDVPTGFVCRWNADGTRDVSGSFFGPYSLATWPSITGETPSTMYKDLSELYDVAAHRTGLFTGGYFNYYYSNTRAIGLSLDFTTLDTSLSGKSAVKNDISSYTPDRDGITCIHTLSDLSCVFLGNSGYSGTQQLWLSKLGASLQRDSSFHQTPTVPKSHNYFVPLDAGSTSESGYDFLFDTDSSIIIVGSSTRSGSNYGTVTKLKLNRTPTGVRNETVVKFPQLYPNPTKEYIHLDAKAVSDVAAVVSVYNISGQLVISLPNFPERLSVAHLTNGQYFVMSEGRVIGTFIKE